jgi:hypothetical protein
MAIGKRNRHQRGERESAIYISDTPGSLETSVGLQFIYVRVYSETSRPSDLMELTSLLRAGSQLRSSDGMGLLCNFVLLVSVFPFFKGAYFFRANLFGK